MTKRIAILGSTGSIGTQALEIIKNHPDKYTVEILTSNNNSKLLIQQAKEFKPNAVVIAGEKHYKKVRDGLEEEPIKVFAGHESLKQIVSSEQVDMVLMALVGFSALEPTIEAIKSNKPIALANKEALVVAGEIINKLVKEHQGIIIPVDSEHAAIYQCLSGEHPENIEKITLTASGGPFRGFSKNELMNVSVKEALDHPNWNMGTKITIDSATMMNKGLEVIEARWLFGLPAQKIDVVIHPQSIIHGLVHFKDGSVKAQLSTPDMRFPIQYAFSYPKRHENTFTKFNFFDYPMLSFEKPDLENFRNLALAFEAMDKGGNQPCILNASNEIAVDGFLNGKLNFFDITRVIEKALSDMNYISRPTLEDLIETDAETRSYTRSLIV